ncbi:1-acyl-sn-glycerol-3-phosphate acyltransferase 1, chloroplastic, partial [Tetrabaena socialis]
RLAQHFVNNIWACVSTSLFYPVTIVGRENLPPSDRPVVYVANHQSFLGGPAGAPALEDRPEGDCLGSATVRAP